MKKIFLVLICIICFAPAVFAEKLVIKITPIQEISTHHDEVDVEDWIKFKVVNDVYYKNKLFITKNTVVTGIVDSVHENGLFADNAEIIFVEFKLRDVNNKLTTIKYPLHLNRKNSICYCFADKIAKNIGVIFKGNEILIKPETITYNLILNK